MVTCDIPLAEKAAIPNASAWYSIEEILQIRQCSLRTLRIELAKLSSNLIRELPAEGRGRPPHLYHYRAFPELVSDYMLNRSGDRPADPDVLPGQSEEEVSSDKKRVISPDDLAVAELRLRAVTEYQDRKKFLPREAAARETCRDWERKPRTIAIKIEERLPMPDGGYHTRKADRLVGIGSFCDRTLRTWESLYIVRKDILSLVPQLKGKVGRKQEEIPADLFDFVYAIACSSPRATVKYAVEYAVEVARQKWPGTWPAISMATWRRRFEHKDPRDYGKDLMSSISTFRKKHSPDIEMDWSVLPYNGRWELDDVTQDWYGWASDFQRILRPYAYAIMRTRTRQFIAVVASECRITQEQVRTLVGTTMADKQGGMPDLIKFERGTIALENNLKYLLATLGVKTSLTGMDEGAALPGLMPDIATGHFQGKGTVERAFQKMHNAGAFMIGQTGPNERETAASRDERLRTYAKKHYEETGQHVIFPSAMEWHQITLKLLEKHNNTPHSALPEILDPETGKKRHLTPNEEAKRLADQSIRVMDEQLLPRFFAKGERVKVTRNGFTLNNFSYGRFDDELTAFDEVTAYADVTCPQVAYVVELGRCVDLYKKADPLNDAGDQFGKKMHQEKKMRNQFEETVARAMATGGDLMVQSIQMTRNPVPERTCTVVTDETLRKQADAIRAARAAKREEAIQDNNRFAPLSDKVDPEAPAGIRRRSRRNIFTATAGIDDVLLGNRSNKQEEAPCSQE